MTAAAGIEISTGGHSALGPGQGLAKTPAGIFGNAIAAGTATSTTGAGAASFRSGWQSLLASMNAGTSLDGLSSFDGLKDGLKDGLGNEQSASAAETLAGTTASLPAASVLTATIPFLKSMPIEVPAEASASGKTASTATAAQAIPGAGTDLLRSATYLATQTAATFSTTRAAVTAKSDSTKESTSSQSTKENKRSAASSDGTSGSSVMAAVQIPSSATVIVQPVQQASPTSTDSVSTQSNRAASNESASTVFASLNSGSMVRDYSFPSSVTRVAGSRQAPTDSSSSVSAVSRASSDESAEESSEKTNSQGRANSGLANGSDPVSSDELGSSHERFLDSSSLTQAKSAYEQSQTVGSGKVAATPVAAAATAKQTVDIHQWASRQSSATSDGASTSVPTSVPTSASAQSSATASPYATETAGLARGRADATAPQALLNKLPFTSDAAGTSPVSSQTVSSQTVSSQTVASQTVASQTVAPSVSQGNSGRTKTLEAADGSQAISNPGDVAEDPATEALGTTSSLLPAASNASAAEATSSSASIPAKLTPIASGSAARRFSFAAPRAATQSAGGSITPASTPAAMEATTGTNSRRSQVEDSSASPDQNKGGSPAQSSIAGAVPKADAAVTGSSARQPITNADEVVPAASSRNLAHISSATASADSAAQTADSASDAAGAEAAASTRSARTAKQGTTGTTHSGASTEASASLPAHAQTETSTLQGNPQAHDPSGTRGTIASSIPSSSGNSTGSDSESTTSKTFAALDSEPKTQSTSWIRAGAQQAEAGYKDPELGWVGVRADSSGGVVHASLVPGSADASATLGSHLEGLNSYLAEHHAQVGTITVAAPESRSMGTEMGQSSHQQMSQGNGQGAQESAGQQAVLNMGSNSGQGSEQGSSAEQYFASRTAASATAAAGSPETVGSTNTTETVEASGSNGVHISVVA